jgi:hypothetical protein
MRQSEMPSKLQQQLVKGPLYVRLVYAALIVFAVVGNFAGNRIESLVVLGMTSIVWVCARILKEAIDAYRILQAAKDQEKQGDPDGPPTP